MNQIINNNKQKEPKNETFWMPTGRNLKITLISLLIFGLLLAIFSTGVFIIYAREHIFMNSLRDLFQMIFDTLKASKKFQTPENQAHLFNICIFNYYYTNFLLLFSPRSIFSMIFSFIPNIGIIDLIVGYSLIFFSSMNLIFLKFDLSKVFSHPIDPQVLFAANSFIIPMTLIGYFLEDMFILGFCGLCWTLISFYIINLIPFGNKK
ncbi:MAG: hypothetical protein ACFFDN_08870 [Candidatus Hodarchaeota archaeon]